MMMMNGGSLVCSAEIEAAVADFSNSIQLTVAYYF